MCPESTVPMHPQLRPFNVQLFLDFRAIFSPERPLIFLVSTIHQVIWPSPGTLHVTPIAYGVASVSRIDKITGRFCKRALCKKQYYAKETCSLIDPTDRSHSICDPSVPHPICDPSVPRALELYQVCTSTTQCHRCHRPWPAPQARPRAAQVSPTS